MGYEPIWPLYHSFVAYHQSIWTDCNEYDQIPLDQLEYHSEAYTPFSDGLYDDYIALGLDERMMFPGLLPFREWSFINQNELTVRKMWDQAKWNIKYDLMDGSGFYTDSGLSEYCKGKLNESWFILDEAVGDSAENRVDAIDVNISNVDKHWNEILIFGGALMVFLLILVHYKAGCYKKNGLLMTRDHESGEDRYGSVYYVHL